jgi:hypothetical protein
MVQPENVAGHPPVLPDGSHFTHLRHAYRIVKKPTSVQEMAMNAARMDSPAMRPEAIGIANASQFFR